MRHSAYVLFAALSLGCSAIALSGGCSSGETHGKTPPLAGGTGGSGGSGGGIATSSGHSSSHASSSHASSGSGTGGNGGAGGSGGSSLPAHCSDLIKNDSETDVDCGGDCAPCDDYAMCLHPGDCQSQHCLAGICQPPNCTDGLENEDESDIDCGGLICNGCLPGKHCNMADDCESKVCSPQSKCLAPSCTDHQQNGTESDVDCGGNCQVLCDPGQKCNGPDDCVGSICQGTCQCPSGMVVAPYGSGTYCIDSAEVTYAAYNPFWIGGSTGSQPSYCSWNTDFTPTGDWPPNQQNLQEPVRYVDWCDADAFCRFVGKHLCGKIQGGSTSAADYFDASTDQWFNACSARGNNDYPYGDGYLPLVCNGSGATTHAPWSTSNTTCIGGEIGLFDMSGDVAEWEDGCDAASGETDLCPARGGSFLSDQAELRCDSGGTADMRARDYQGRDVGFRCCL